MVAVQTDTGGSFRITVNDKILVHLIEYVRYQERPEVPREVTQQGIAEIVNARRSHVSLALTTLKEKGLVEERTARVTDEVRRRKVYSLTSKGLEAAKKLTAGFNERDVRIEDASGVKTVKVAELPEVLGEKYYLVDVLCCISRDGTLDIAQLTGQQVESPAITMEGPLNSGDTETPSFQPPPMPSKETAESPMAVAPESARQPSRAIATCPACGITVQFQYEDAGLISVICGACGGAFKATIGTPIQSATPTESSAASEPRPQHAMAGTGMVSLTVGTIFSAMASILLFVPLVLSASCLMLSISIPFLLIATVRMRAKSERSWVGLATLLSATAPIFFVSARTGLLAVGFEYTATSLLIAMEISLMGGSNRRKLGYAAGFAALAAAIPCIGPIGIPIATGPLVAAAALIGITSYRIDRQVQRDLDAVVAASLLTALGFISLFHWAFQPRWDWGSLGRLFLVAVTLYAFALLAKPIAAKSRAEMTAVLGVFLMALASSVIVAPWLVGLAPVLAAFSFVIGAGAVYLADRVHKLEDRWPIACLGAGLFVITVSLATLATRRASLSLQWQIALVMWTAAGAALCGARFAPQVVELLASLRAGVIAAIGAALALAGVYMLAIGISVEGTIEVGLGLPLLGFAVFKSGAPWAQRLEMTGLFVATVAATWLAFVMPA